MTKMSAKSEALAFRIWAYADPRGWNCSVKEIAEAIEDNPQRVGRILQEKKWLYRLRVADRQWQVEVWARATHPVGGSLDSEVRAVQREALRMIGVQ